MKSLLRQDPTVTQSPKCTCYYLTESWCFSIMLCACRLSCDSYPFFSHQSDKPSRVTATNFSIYIHKWVDRLVPLMEKFSRKLVSRIVYINILQASSPELLRMFLSRKGWNLVCLWYVCSYIKGFLIQTFTSAMPCL